jgi:hypothetical protein
VVYYYAKDRNAIQQNGTTPDGVNVKAHTIDSVLRSGGTWTDISVDNYGNPMIVYGDILRTGTYDGVRMAYRSNGSNGVQFTGTLKCPVTGADITGWEALTMPAGFEVNSDRLNIEAWPPTVRGGTLGTRTGTNDTWNAAIGYADTRYRVGYFFWPTWKSY